MIGITNIEIVQNIKYNLAVKSGNIKVIDYDGTIIDEQLLNTGQVYTIPNPPIHQKLVFDGWYCTQDIYDNKVIVGNDDIIIVAFYTTESGLTEFDIDVNESTVSSKEVYVTNNNGSIDWGDGTIGGGGRHTYSSYGTYTIKINTDRLNGTYTSSGNRACVWCSNTTSAALLTAVRMSNKVVYLGQTTFYNTSKLKYISLSKNIIDADRQSFYCAYSVKMLAFPNITSIPNEFFRYCSNLKYLIACNVTSLANSSFNSANSLLKVKLSNNLNFMGTSVFYNCSLLKEVNTNNIDSLGNHTFYYCNLLSHINVYYTGNITIGTYVFYNCYTLKSVKIYGDISSIGQYAFYGCKCLMECDFGSCTSVPTLENVNAFDGIHPLCKIKVPSNLYSEWITATNWSAYANHITISDNYATINFTGTDSIDVYMDDNLLTNTTFVWHIKPELKYYAYDSTNNIVLPTQIITNITNNSVQNIDIDLSSKKKITLHIGISGLYVIFIIEGKKYYAIEDNGDYYIYVVGSSIGIYYFIDGGDNYLNENGTIITTGSNITENITLTAATTSSFVRPNLTTEGSMGGDSFAVSAKSSSQSNYPAWRAVDSSLSSSYYWRAPDGGGSFTFYNPDSLKVTQIVIYYSTYYADSVTIQGSQDNTNWDDITSTYSYSSTGTLTLTNNKYYKYYKLYFVPNTSSVRVCVYDMQITATVKTAAV